MFVVVSGGFCGSAAGGIPVARASSPCAASISAHESAHAVIGRLLGLPVMHASLDPPEIFVDYEEPPPEITLRRMVAVVLAGVAMTGSGGAVDEQNATKRCRKIIAMRWGRIGRVSQAVALKRTMRKIARRLVRRNRATILRVAAELLRRGRLEQREIDALMGGT
jgi:hypothetical protein